MQHRQTLREALALASDSSDASSSNQQISADPEVRSEISPNLDTYRDRHALALDLDFDGSDPYSMEVDGTQEQWDEDLVFDGNEHTPEGDGSDESQGEESEGELQDDDITNEDLMRVIQDQYGDEWQRELRLLHENE
jgi:hypothetical protein